MSVIEPLRRAVVEAFGDRCPDYEPNCMGCQAWAALDEAERLDAQAVSRSGFDDRTLLTALDLTEAQAAALMDGSAVVVPVEPSAEMISAMNSVWQDWPDLTVERVASCRWAALMNAVYAASQHEETKG